MRSLTLLLLLAVALALAGCIPTQTRQYSISVTNHTPAPLTVGVVKNGGPYEPTWRRPEDDAISLPGGRIRPWGVVIPPGRTADTAATGKFHFDSLALLRIYSGQLSATDLLAISSGDSCRMDLPLSPGRNDIIVSNPNGKLTATFGPSPAVPSLTTNPTASPNR